ncbi:MAG: trimethylamine methyltransferase family protein [Candidatus Omnitrophica bacterium]|nr:trimethylamine methyltransferase family protein [Candidatus Omnitrophota bacterium]
MFFNPKEEYKVLNKKEIEKIHHYSVKILSEIGVKIPDERFLKFLSSRCNVDFNNQIVKFPESLIEEVIESIRKEEKKIDIPEKIEIKGSVGGFTPNIYDFEKGRRKPTLEDVEKALRIGNQLDQVSNNSVLFIPMDCFPYHDLWAYAVALTRSIKPSSAPILKKESLKVIVEICDIAGRNRPMYQCFLSSPLRFPEYELDIAYEALKIGLRVNFGTPMTVLGATGPIDIAGTITLCNAETICGWILNYLFSQPIYGYGGNPVSMDMRTGCGNYANPLTVIMNSAIPDLCRFYGLIPEGGHLGDTDSPTPGIKAAVERLFTSLISLIVNDTKKVSFRIGVLGPAGSCGCLEQMVIDAEIVRILNKFFEGIEVDDEKINYKLIKEVGIGGSFLDKEDTILKMRQIMFFPKIFSFEIEDSLNFEIENAKKKTEELLKKEKFHPLTQDKEKEIFKIVKNFTKIDKEI